MSLSAWNRIYLYNILILIFVDFGGELSVMDGSPYFLLSLFDSEE